MGEVTMLFVCPIKLCSRGWMTSAHVILECSIRFRASRLLPGINIDV